MNSIKATPAYWKKSKSEVLAMVKRLGAPASFLTLATADLRSNESVEIIQKLSKVDFHISYLSNHNSVIATLLLLQGIVSIE